MDSTTVIFVFALLFCATSQTLAQSFTCLDLDSDFAASGWGDSFSSRNYAQDDSDLPTAFQGKLPGQGIFYFRGDSAYPIQGFSRPAQSGKEYIYVRYYAHHISGGNNQQYYVYPAVGTEARAFLDATADYQWKEAYFEINSGDTYNRVVSTTARSTADYLFIDKVIYTNGRDVGSIGDIKALCPDGTAPPPVDTTPGGGTTQPDDGSTTSTTTPRPPPPGGVTIEWIDLESDLDSSLWSKPASLKYAATGADLPAPVQGRLDGNGIFYFQGLSFSVAVNQALSRSAHSGKGGEAFLYLRYYVHHTSAGDDQAYYVFPVPNKPLGMLYLDATPDFTWKEEFVQLDTAGAFPTETGMFSTSPDDFYLIEKMIFLYRAPGAEKMTIMDKEALSLIGLLAK